MAAAGFSGGWRSTDAASQAAGCSVLQRVLVWLGTEAWRVTDRPWPRPSLPPPPPPLFFHRISLVYLLHSFTNSKSQKTGLVLLFVSLTLHSVYSSASISCSFTADWHSCNSKGIEREEEEEEERELDSLSRGQCGNVMNGNFRAERRQHRDGELEENKRR